MGEKGYGSIYGSTWWGSGDAFTNTIGWGSAMFYILDPAQFQQRALADGAIMEGFGCASESIRTMGERDSADTIFLAYDKRVFYDGGSTEARVCTIKEISLLR